jgi:uncharacterized protein (DUF433 family)
MLGALTQESRLIEQDPHHPGVYDARVVDVAVPVRALVGYLQRAAGNNMQTVAEDYDIPVQAVYAAVAYYGLHTDAIDARIQANKIPHVSSSR